MNKFLIIDQWIFIISLICIVFALLFPFGFFTGIFVLITIIKIFYSYLIIKSLCSILLIIYSILLGNIIMNLKKLILFIPLMILTILTIYIMFHYFYTEHYVRKIIILELILLIFGIISWLSYWLLNQKIDKKLSQKILLIIVLPLSNYSLFHLRYLFSDLI